MIKTIPVDIKRLEKVFDVDLHAFVPGHNYPLEALMAALNLKFRREGTV